MHFETLHNEIKCVLSVKESNFNEKNIKIFTFAYGQGRGGRDTPSPPGDQWQFHDWDQKTWREVDNSFTLEYTFLAPCQSLRVSGNLGRRQFDWLGDYADSTGRESFGEYRSPF